MRILCLISALLCSGLSYGQNWDFLAGTNWHIARFYDDTATGKLIACGAFDTAGTVPVQGIAAWDGTTWNALGIPTLPSAPSITAVHRYNGDLLLGGFFPSWDSNRAFIASWNGTTLDSFASFKWSSPYGLTEFEGDLIAYGSFDTINNTAVNKIGRWNGTSWSDMGFNTFEGLIQDAIVYAGELYVCGFSSATQENHVFRYQNNSWQAVGQTIVGPGTLITLCVYNGDLYAGGCFTKSFSAANPGNCVIKLDTAAQTWSSPGGGIDLSATTVAQLIVFNNELFAVGAFGQAGGVPANNVAKWDGFQWCGFGVGLSAGIYSAAAYNGRLYLGTGSLFDNAQTEFFVEWIGGNYVDSCGVTAVQEHERPDRILMYPNPAHDNITIQFLNAPQSGTIILFDQIGREVLRQKVNGEDRIQLSVAELATGMYFYRIEISDSTIAISGKFVLE